METGYFLCYVRAEGEKKIHDLIKKNEHGLFYKYVQMPLNIFTRQILNSLFHPAS